MEEQIKKLAEEAGFLTEDGNFYTDSFHAINDEVEEFAKLIIEKCMEVADMAMNEQHDLFLPSELIAKHFGLEVEYE